MRLANIAVALTLNGELANPVNVPSVTVSVTPVAACLKVVFNVVVDTPAVNDTHVV